MDIQIEKKGYWLKHPAISLLIFTLVILLLRIVLRGPVLLLDEAEQATMAQELSPGYPSQPPLYTWLQYGFFKLFGVNLFSLAILKCSLLFGCFYFFYLICRKHCENDLLAWCGLLSWVLIPSIGLDLIKDNTHSVLVLFVACLTWYWLIIAEQIPKALWYSFFGCLIGIGILSKFNYVLFFIILFFSSLTIKEFRQRLINPYMILTFLAAFLITSPYLKWLLTHPVIGLSSAYKLHPPGIPLSQGLMEFIRACLFFAAPAFLFLAIYFSKARTLALKKSNLLLFRYHLLVLPLLAAIILIAGFRNFETRWLVPILFLCPAFYLSQVKYTPALKPRIILYLNLCLLTQVLFFVILVYNSHSESTKQKQLALNKMIELTKINATKLDYIVSDSYWLLGNLMITLPTKKIWLIQTAKQLLPKGKSLIFWNNAFIPYWVADLVRTRSLTELNLIVDSQSKRVIAGQAYAYQ